ncbi:UDP-N-acetylmuramate dehydrogenase [bacterium]|nr:MAG: UDP-N-acetylmuramate dehydrogenase [bacterium]
MNWLDGLRAKILFDEPLSRRTTLRVGPRARLWVEPDSLSDLSALLKKAKSRHKDYLVIGCGSKLLIKKKAVALAIHLNSFDFKQCRIEQDELIAGAGLSLPHLLKTAYDNGLGGLEFLSGIPASLGGAIMLNAGVSWPARVEIGELVRELKVIDKSGVSKTLDKKSLRFGYRHSNLKGYIIVSARLKLLRGRKKDIKLKMKEFLDYRRRTQELSYASAGCAFKNPEGVSSGRLIDLCGLKGRSVGGAAISLKHANFIVNTGKASSSDILALMDLAKEEVKKRFGIALEPEIRII